MRRVFAKESFFSAPPEELFALHERPDAFRLLTPPDFAVEVESTASTLRPSEDVVRFTVRVLGVPFRHGMVHTVYEPPTLFADEQLTGPFTTWKHEHRFIRGGWSGDPATRLVDRIEYSHPMLFAANPVVSLPLRKLFTARHDITRREVLAAMRERRSGEEPQRVVITGATGLIGRRLAEVLVEKGAQVTAFVRSPESARRTLGARVTPAVWDFTRPDEGDWRPALAAADAVVHLAGTPLFSKRWNPDFKRAMKRSRTESTRQLVEAIAAAPHRPRVFVSASAVGIYGTDPRQLVDESYPPADDLLADICADWEAEARKLDDVGVRTVQVRIGVVLHPSSGALKEMLPLFWFGLGGVLGRPDGWINWIHLEDVVRIFHTAIADDGLHGPVNAVAPHPVTNQTLAYTLAHVLGRPCLMRYPTFLIRLGIGEAAEYASGGSRVRADRIRSRGYTHFFHDLEPALRSLLNRPRP